ncbi:MAG: choice-of-anchor R domain-containing protein [Patescibacteria group bacterium]
MRNNHNKSGQILLLTLLVIGMTSVAGVLLHRVLNNNNNFANLRNHQETALELAEAGIEHARWDLNYNLNLTGSSVTLPNGEFVTTFNQITGSLIEIESTGYSPSQAAAKATRTLRTNIVINTTDVSFNYGVQVGEGGVTMGSNSVINGNIFSNGSISGSGKVYGTVQVATGSQFSYSHELKSDFPDGDYVLGHNLDVLDVAQSFVPSDTAPITKVSLKLKKYCKDDKDKNCPADRPLKILGDNGGSPDKNNIIAEGILDEDLVSMSIFDWANIDIDTPTTLNAGTTYWIVLPTSDNYATGNPNSYWWWAKDKNNGYGNGLAKYSPRWDTPGSPSWTTITGDMNFKVFMGSNTTYIDGITINDNPAEPGSGKAYAYEIKDCDIASEAFYMVIDGATKVGGSSCPNANCHSDQPAPGLESLPISDANITDFKNEAIAGVPIIGNYALDDSIGSLGPAEITGDLSLDNNAELTVTGTIYVHGDINLSNNSIIHLASGYGPLSGIVVTDGEVDVNNNVQFCGSGWNGTTCDTTGGSYIMLLTTSNKQDLADPAIDVSNNTEAVIFYSSQGAITLQNGADLYEATAYKLHLNNLAEVSYESGLANAKFTSGPGASWQIQPNTWREIID